MKNLCTFILVSCMIIFVYGAPAKSDSDNGNNNDATNESCPPKGENNMPSCECMRELLHEATTETSISLGNFGVDKLTNAVFVAVLPGINCEEE